MSSSNRSASLFGIGQRKPIVHDSAYVAPGATIIGSVSIGENASVWFGSVIRGDNDQITLGANVNIQDACVLHTDPGFHLELADDVSVGHQSMVHGCKVDKGSLIGIQSVVLNGAEIGEYCLIGAKSLITEGKKIPPYSMVVGSPGRVLRELKENEIALLKKITKSYVERARVYRTELTAV